MITVIYHRADFDGLYNTLEPWGTWKPSIHMPRRASRITLEIVNVRVERLQDISPDDCRAEGIRCTIDYGGEYIAWFERLWESIHGENSWDENPWLWVIEFEMVKR